MALDATWPAALVERIVTAFSQPAAQIVLLPWPTPNQDRPKPVSPQVDSVIKHAPGTEPNPELADAVHTVERLSRHARVEHVPADPTATNPTSPPLRTGHVGGCDPGFATIPATPAAAVEKGAHHDKPVTFGGADLVITSLHPRDRGDRGADLVALFAARLLRVGGILIVLTHCDWTSGELTDPTGAVVTAGQNADLLYLQHIVAVHAPLRDGRFHLTDTHPDHHCEDTPDDEDTSDARARARHHAPVRGLPTPHRRIHSDVLIFAQPHDHQPPPPSTGAPSHDGDLR
ncbi:hypothetical protein EKG83_14410 [Saccharothrix syringae]|uniref:Uncharacterized protein n=1 Tax=Saccharothrix syringae TaxID=103733 RepID=A0A5Q0HF86_SACSY|nr:hypothetical protein EKG83_14410 [Saccharothrix syringae]